MSEPFFDYISNSRFSVSNKMYGIESHEKRYHRYQYNALPVVQKPSITLVEAMAKRKSYRKFKDDGLPLEKLSSVLKFSISVNEESKGFKKYSFPSGGGFYPIETYLIVNKVSDLEAGLYHYATVDHSIAKIKESDECSLQEVNQLYGCSFDSVPPVILHMTMVKSRTIHKYGSLAYVLSLSESGYRGQNIYLAASAFDLGVCAMGGGNYEKINQLLGVDGVNEHHIHGVAIGLPAKELLTKYPEGQL